MNSREIIEKENIVCAPNYLPIPVVLTKGEDIWLFDIEGKKYLDMMSAYSAVSFGHSNKRIYDVLVNQAKKLSIVSRAFYTDKLQPFLEKICSMSKLEMALPMNTGAEAVETAIKAARRWGYEVKGIPDNKAEIIVARDNFHGRTTTITSFSTEEDYRKNFGPFTPGFKFVDFGNFKQLENAINENTCAFLVEPMQGEGGIKIPENGWLKKVSEHCKKNKVLLILDEVQTGLGRTGKLFAFQHEDIIPDGLILGKALGGGIFPVSVFLSSKEVLSLLVPGSHGSTFGGNPLGASIAYEILCMLEEGDFINNSEQLGNYFLQELKNIKSNFIVDVRGKGLWIGVELNKNKISTRKVCERLMDKGILSKETHETVIRFAPPLTITKKEIDWCVSEFKNVLESF